MDLTMEKGNLLIYDYFSIHQEFEHPGDSICVLSNQILEYGVKYKDQASTCTTVTNFSDYNFNPGFPAKFFNNELSVTEQTAYDKDSTYWKEKRKSELSPEEKKYIAVRDSIYDYQNRTEYLDSVDKVFNKVTALKVPRGFAVIPVLFHIGGVSSNVATSDYFYRIIDISDFLRAED